MITQQQAIAQGWTEKEWKEYIERYFEEEDREA